MTDGKYGSRFLEYICYVHQELVLVDPRLNLHKQKHSGEKFQVLEYSLLRIYLEI